MARKLDPNKLDSPQAIPTLSFTFMRVFSVAASGSVGVVAGFVLSILGIAGVIALVIVAHYFGLTIPGLVRLIVPRPIG